MPAEVTFDLGGGEFLKGYIFEIIGLCNPDPGARPTKHISIEFEIRWKFRML